MKVAFSLIKNCELYIWGRGTLFYRYFDSFKNLSIKAVIDIDKNKWSKSTGLNKIDCISPEEASSSYPVIVTVENPVAVKEITKNLDNRNISWCYIIDVVDEFFLSRFKEEEEEIYENNPKISKFIDVMLPVTSCNFKCSYCYLSQIGNLKKYPLILHNAKFIRYALRKKRLGGTAFINICGVGETFLCKELIPIISELIKEGHFIQIVSNATSKKMINDLIESNIDPEHLFVKCSLHWQELNKKKLLDVYAENVNALWKHGISITVELVPCDEIIDDIPIIKDFCINKFGALPHVTVTRDERKENFPIITRFSEEEYEQIWSVFNSQMFNFKIRNREKICLDCNAGLWAVYLNLATGELYKCTGHPRICNIYESVDKDIPFEKVGNKCCLPYCFNNHAYLTLGLIPDITTPTYLEMRDRTTLTGKHWIQGKIRTIFEQKLYETNYVE